MNMKGISPLIAAVLLIAVTMTIAGVLAFWGSTYIRGQTQVFSNETSATFGECNFQKFEIDACSFDSDLERVTFILDNTGTVPVSNITVIAFYPDLSLNSTVVSGTVQSGRLGSFAADSIGGGFTKLEIRTQCPDKSLETSCA